MTADTIYDLFDDEVFAVIEVQSKRLHRISPTLTMDKSCLSLYKQIKIADLKVLIVVPFLSEYSSDMSLYESKGIYYVPVVHIPNYDNDIETRLYRFFLPVAMIVLTKLMVYLRSTKRRIVMVGHGADVDTLLTNDLKYDNCVGIRSFADIYNMEEDTVNRINEKLTAIGLSTID